MQIMTFDEIRGYDYIETGLNLAGEPEVDEPAMCGMCDEELSYLSRPDQHGTCQGCLEKMAEAIENEMYDHPNYYAHISQACGVAEDWMSRQPSRYMGAILEPDDFTEIDGETGDPIN